MCSTRPNVIYQSLSCYPQIDAAKNTHRHILFSNMQCKRPYPIIHLTSAIYQPFGCYPIPVSICSKPKKKMLVHVIHEARRKTTAHQLMTTSTLHHTCSAEALRIKSIFLSTNVHPDKYNHNTSKTLKQTFLYLYYLFLLHSWTYLLFVFNFYCLSFISLLLIILNSSPPCIAVHIL